MKAVELWQPSKFVQSVKTGRWVANRKHVSAGSWYIVDLFAPVYEQVIRAYARGRLLDLGCGMVPFYGMYKDLVAENVCIDWANSLHSNPHLDVVADLNQSFPLPDASFDTVLCSDVLEHIAEPAAFLRETARVLKPGGTLLLMVPFFYWLHEQPHDYFRYTEFALRRMCGQAGFAIQSIEAYGGYPDVVLDILSKGLARRSWLVRPFLWLTQPMSQSGFGGRWRQRTATTFPLGYVVVAETPRVPKV
jgi:SAM-dependent methyltransferase